MASASSSEKLRLQIDELQDFILEAKRKSIRIAYLIIGKGEGVLRKAVIKELQKKGVVHAEVANPPYFGNAIKVYL